MKPVGLKMVESAGCQRLFAALCRNEDLMSPTEQRNLPSGDSTPRNDPSRMEIADLAQNRLRNNPYLALKRVSCDYQEGALTLRGRLPSYFLKQMAQAVISPLEGVQIINQIEVENHP